MGQMDILDFLREERKKSDRWFSVEEIKSALLKQGLSYGTVKRANQDIIKLCTFNLIDFKGIGWYQHRKLFRAKNEKKK